MIKIKVEKLSKKFILHHQNCIEINVLEDINFQVRSHECFILYGNSGSGKSTLLKMMYGNYLPTSGSLKVQKDPTGWIEMVGANPRSIIELRKSTIGYVSQFFKTIPRVSTLNVVMEPALLRGSTEKHAKDKACYLLERLNVASHLWNLAPNTFSGGEQQRVNIARGFMVNWPIILLDEPTASLDDVNCEIVLELMREAKQEGSALIGIFHDSRIRSKIGDRMFNITYNRVDNHVI